MALAGKMDSKDYRVYCLMGDGELQEGQNWEAAMFAHRYGLNNLIGFVDRNRLQICGNTEEVMSLDPLPEKFRAFGWNVIIIDGHNIRQIIDACDKAARSKKNPTVIIMNTIKGKGVLSGGQGDYAQRGVRRAVRRTERIGERNRNRSGRQSNR